MITEELKPVYHLPSKKESVAMCGQVVGGSGGKDHWFAWRGNTNVCSTCVVLDRKAVVK